MVYIENLHPAQPLTEAGEHLDYLLMAHDLQIMIHCRSSSSSTAVVRGFAQDLHNSSTHPTQETCI